MQNDAAKIWRILSKRIDYCVAELVAPLVPLPLLEMIWGVLDETRHDVLAGRCYRRIREAWNHNIDIRPTGIPSVLGFVIRAFHVLHTRRNGNGSAQMRSFAGEALEVWQSIES